MSELFRDLHADSTTDLDGILSGKVAMDGPAIAEAAEVKNLVETITTEQELVSKLKPLSEVDIFSFMKNLRGGTFFNMGMFTSIPVARAHKKTYRIYKVVNMTAIVSGVSYENVGTTKEFRDQTGKAPGKAFYDHVPGYENKVGVGKNNPNNKYILWDVKESSGNWVGFYLVDIATGATHTIARDVLLASPYLTNTEKDKLTPKPVTGFDLNTGALVTNETVWRTAKFEHVFWLSQQGANTQEYGAKFAESLVASDLKEAAGKGELFRDIHADSKTDLDGILSGAVTEEVEKDTDAEEAKRFPNKVTIDKDGEKVVRKNGKAVTESYRRIITVDHSLVDNELFVDFE